MKKVLFATTALVMTAGVAAAEVSLSGDGRMGVIYDGDEAAFTSRARVTFTLTGESDAGLSFGGSFRADNASDAKVGAAGSVYVSGAFGKLSMGDVDGAAEAAVGDLSGVGLTGLGDLNETIYLHGTDTATASMGGVDDDSSIYALPAALYEYSTGAVTVYASIGNPAGKTIKVGGSTIEFDKQYSLGLKYAAGNYSVGVGYETLEAALNGVSATADHWVLGGQAELGAATIKAIYGQASDLDLKQYGVSVDYAMAPTTLTGFVRKVEFLGTEVTAYGLGASYDLGGGASFVGGIVDTDAAGTDPKVDLGVSFTF